MNVIRRLLGVVLNGSKLVLSAMLALPLILLFLFVELTYGKQIVEGIGVYDVPSVLSVGVVLACGVGLLFMGLIRRTEPVPPRLFLGISLAAATLLYYAYVSSIEVAWISDFQTMWDYAVRMVARSDYSVRDIYGERALPVLVPLILLFGAKTWIVPLANLVMLLGIQLAGYDLMRRIAGHRAAQGFVVLWLGAMEPVLALPITSHDIWGLFYLVILLWGFRVLNDRLRSADLAQPRNRWWWLLGAVLLAVLLTVLDMQRELAPFVVLGSALAFGMLALTRNAVDPELKRTALIAVSIIILHLGMATALKAGGMMMTAEQGAKLAQIRIGAYSSSLGNGRYWQGEAFARSFFDTVDVNQGTDLARAIPLSDYALQPFARIGNVIHRVQGQAHLGSQ